MPGPDGIAVTRILREILPSIRVLIVTMFEDATTLAEALAAGAAGYLPKRLAGSELIDAVHMVANGGTYLPPSLPDKGVSAPCPDWPETPCTLDVEELQLLRQLAGGNTKSQIVRQLNLSLEAVDIRIAGLIARVGSSRRVDLLRYAQEYGII